MNMFRWVEKRAKTFKWFDFSILKLTMLCFALWLAIVWPSILGLGSWTYFILFAAGWVYLLWRMFR